MRFRLPRLAKGTYTGSVTVSDPNALDAPQRITITATVGGSVPDKLDLFAKPGSTPATATFTSNAAVTSTVTTDNGGAWLSVASVSGGSGSGAASDLPILTYRISANPSGLAEGTYTGTVKTTGGATNSYDTRTIPVTFKVTSQPIAVAAPTTVGFRIAANSAKQTLGFYVNNISSGTLTISGVTPTGAPAWLTTQVNDNLVLLTADPAGLQPGVYTTTVAVATNAANTGLTVPVSLEVPATGAPIAGAQGAVNNTIYEQGDNIAPGAIVSLFGEQLTTGTPVGASHVPLDTQMGGARVLVNDVPAPLFYVAYNQINFQLPFETSPGQATIRVERDGQKGNATYVTVAASAPRVLRTWIKDYGVVVNQDGSLVMATTVGIPSHPAKPGDVLVIWGSGLGQSTPPLATGAGAPGTEPLARVPNVRVRLGTRFFDDNVVVIPDYAGYAPFLVGSFQINFKVPENAPKGLEVPLTVEIGDPGAPLPSNRVIVAIQ